MSRSLAEILRTLPATGPLGFEGLIANLLSHVTGQRFHLAQSGTQEGRDLSSRHPSANVTAVECKRYRSNTELDERELLGEIVQATLAIPDLDLWVLVASRNVPSQLRETLHRALSDRSVELIIIADGDGAPSSLALLCAQGPEIVEDTIQRHSLGEVPRVQAILAEIAATPDYEKRCASLKASFLTPLLGYDSWRNKQNTRVSQSFRSKAAAFARFGQLLNISEEGVQLIERQEVWQRLDDWLSAWKDDRRPLVVLGQEGDGKTWATASWIQRKIAQDAHFPSVMLFSSAELQVVPLDCLDEQVSAYTVSGAPGAIVFDGFARARWGYAVEKGTFSAPICMKESIYLHGSGLAERFSGGILGTA